MRALMSMPDAHEACLLYAHYRDPRLPSVPTLIAVEQTARGLSCHCRHAFLRQLTAFRHAAMRHCFER